MATHLYPPPPTNHHSLQGYIITETTKAIQFSVESIDGATLDETTLQWFPLSQTKSIFRSNGSEEQDCIVVTDWIMKTKELI
jgi:hypothetical protein